MVRTNILVRSYQSWYGGMVFFLCIVLYGVGNGDCLYCVRLCLQCTIIIETAIPVFVFGSESLTWSSGYYYPLTNLETDGSEKRSSDNPPG